MVMENIPDLIRLSDYGGNWDRYLDAIYQIYLKEVAHAHLSFRSLPIRCRFIPMTDGKGYGFWHMISEGEEEQERVPDLRRCERIRWVPWMIRNFDKGSSICWFENQRRSRKYRRTETHLVLWFRDGKFAVVMDKRKDHLLLLTSYVIYQRREKAFERDWKQFWNND